jgi:hypothetical protein
MFEKKQAVVSSALLFTLFGAPLAASAATPTFSPAAVPVPIFQEDGDDQDGDDDSGANHHDEIHEIIPPVITVPGLGKGRHHKPFNHGLPTTPPVATPEPTDPAIPTGPVDPASVTQSLPGVSVDDSEYVVVASNDPESALPLEAANPNESEPIDVRLIRAQVRNPADQFLESAYIGMGVLGVAAIGLGATAGVRAIRLRRNGKADYFYDNK